MTLSKIIIAAMLVAGGANAKVFTTGKHTVHIHENTLIKDGDKRAVLVTSINKAGETNKYYFHVTCNGGHGLWLIRIGSDIGDVNQWVSGGPAISDQMASYMCEEM